MRRWDVVVVGAGPAGTLAAHQLARGGLEVLLVERKELPRYKVCGGCLNAAALRTLEGAGLGGLPERHGAVPLTAFRLAVAGRNGDVRIPIRGQALDRATFDAALAVAAVAEGAVLVDGTRARVVTRGEGRERIVLDADGRSEEVEANVVVIAAGLGGCRATVEDVTASAGSSRSGGPWSRTGAALRRAAARARTGTTAVAIARPADKIGVGTLLRDGRVEPGAPGVSDGRDYRKGVIHMATAAAGYVGIVRLGDGRLNLAAALRRSALGQRGPAALVAGILDAAGLPAPVGLEGCEWAGTPTLYRMAPDPGRPTLLPVGDAVGYGEPFTGEGMAWALEAAVSVAPVAAHVAGGGDAGEVAAWRRRYRRRLWCRRRVSGLVGALLGTGRWPARLAMAALSRSPSWATPVLRRTERPLLVREEQR